MMQNITVVCLIMSLSLGGHSQMQPPESGGDQLKAESTNTGATAGQELESILQEVFEKLQHWAHGETRRKKRQVETGVSCEEFGRKGTCVPYYRCGAGDVAPADRMKKIPSTFCIGFLDVCCPEADIISEDAPISQENLSRMTLNVFRDQLKPLLLNHCYYAMMESLKSGNIF